MKHLCTICGREKAAGADWFLLTENRWEDKLRVLQWDWRLATHSEVQQVCGAAHVRELVVHWMSTGSLKYPFAQAMAFTLRQWPEFVFPSSYDVWNSESIRLLGELCVDRDSIRRVLSEKPDSLSAILDALSLALRKGRVSVEDFETPELANRIAT